MTTITSNEDLAVYHARVPVSALHSIVVAETLYPLLDRPQEKDFSLHTIARKTGPDGRDLVHSELVIAGRQSRERFPTARVYPIHFLKSYNPWALHGRPENEYENTRAAASILRSPLPIGYDDSSFRAAFIPGKPLSRISPFTNVDPPERCLGIAAETEPAVLIGLWKLAEEVFEQLSKLHEHRFFHGDMELHNIIVCTAPVQAFLIDYESAICDFSGSDEEFEDLRFRDLEELLRLAVYLQAGLGRQENALAQASQDYLPRLFRNADTFNARLDEADRQAGGAAA